MADIDTSLEDAYPGDDTDACELLALANAYAQAADRLHETSRKGLAQAPFRFAAIHAIELYLNAVLRAHGHDVEGVRGLQHDLSQRLTAAKDVGLKLSPRTAAHIDTLTKTREYLKARYAPNENANLSELTRLRQTLQDLRDKAPPIVRGEARKASAGNSSALG